MIKLYLLVKITVEISILVDSGKSNNIINKNNRARILKASLSNNQTVKYSSAMNLGHGNDITYNADINRLVVVHYSPSPYRVSVINPSSLKIEYNKDIKVPSKLEGASSKTLKGIKGYTAIAYSSQRHEYVIRLKQSHNYMLLDANMTPIRYVKVNKYNRDTNQGIDADGNYIYDLQSYSGVRNTITVYDWDGHYLYKVYIPVYYEIESMFHAGTSFYAGFYRSYNKVYYQTKYRTKYKTKTVYKTKKVKWKKVRGKWKYKTKCVYKTKKVRWKKVRGKWKYKTKYVYKTKRVKWKKVRGRWKYKYKKYKVKDTRKVKVKYKEKYKVKCSSFARDNYVYKIRF